MEGAAAGAPAEGRIYLREVRAEMDAEVCGIAGAWEAGCRVVATDSQAATKRCMNLTTGVQNARHWIYERVIKAAGEGLVGNWRGCRDTAGWKGSKGRIEQQRTRLCGDDGRPNPA